MSKHSKEANGPTALNRAFGVYIPARLERRLRKIASIEQDAIREQLLRLARCATVRPPSRAVGPPRRFYEGGHRVFYQLDLDARRVVVLDVKAAFALRAVSSNKPRP